jgi:two-component system NtrC family sensor kinase
MVEKDKTQMALEQFVHLAERHRDGALTEVPIPQKLVQEVSEGIRGIAERLQILQEQLMQYQKMATLGQLIAGIAHEISTPVGSINSNINLFSRSLDRVKTILTSESAPKELREDRQLMQVLSVLDKLNESNKTACDRVVQIVQSLRSSARSDMTELREVDIHQELENALTLVHHEVKRRIKIIRKYGDIPECSCFPNRLNGVFVNMLMNASQAIEGGGQITIETFRDGDNIKVRFTDTGQGIPPENIERLFDPGFTTKAPDEGTGLGLSICKQIMDEHNGKIEVESEVGTGTTFTVTIPIKYEGPANEPQNG